MPSEAAMKIANSYGYSNEWAVSDLAREIDDLRVGDLEQMRARYYANDYHGYVVDEIGKAIAAIKAAERQQAKQVGE